NPGGSRRPGPLPPARIAGPPPRARKRIRIGSPAARSCLAGQVTPVGNRLPPTSWQAGARGPPPESGGPRGRGGGKSPHPTKAHVAVTRPIPRAVKDDAAGKTWP